ncbi:MAG: FimV/HubP family polar landmark protein [Burkholderiales bacterium]
MTLPLLAQAAGLGRLSVQSFLGQPLQAEIEVVSLQPGEEASLEARLASGNAFAQAGIEFNPALSTIQFALDKRGGRPVIRVTTRQSVNEPFIDLLVELRWSTGLFVREYTVLLDPPGYEGPRPQPMAAEPATARAPPVTSAPSAPRPAPAATSTAPKPEAPSQQQTAATPSSDARPAAAQDDKPAAATAAVPRPTQAPAPQAAQAHEVRKGDTLGEIALQYRPEGVSFHQMLIALQRANEDAFIRDNINLVRAGRILNIPDAQTAAAVDAADASRLVIAQHADFAEYRSRLGTAVAAAPAPAQAAERAAAGQITAKPEEPKPAPATDQLKLSKADPKKPGAAAASAAREDDLAARQRALQEAHSRVAELEKNVADLQKLLEMRNQQLAQLEQKAAAKPAAPVATKPAPAAKAAEPSPAAPPTPAKPAAEVAPPAAQSAQPVPAAKPKPKPRPMTPPPPPPEPSLVDEFLGNPVALGGLGAVVLLLGGYGAWAWQRKKKSISKFQDSVLGPGSIAPAALGAEPGLAGAPSVSQSSVSQSAVGGMDTDDVDPIAEADVYMAYGRDAQAEEILKESLQKDPNRVAVLAKLLEIYANRRDAQSFEQHALKLKSVTHGTGAEWDKASALGRSVDPGNGLYGGGGVAPVAAMAAPVAAAAPAVDFDIGGGTAGGSAPRAEAASALDLDLGGASVPAEEKTDFSPSGTLIIDTQEGKAAASGLDFDLGGGADKAYSTAGGLNFELPGASTQVAEPTPPPSSAGGGGLDFDLNLGGDAKADEAPAMDLSTISLDLGTVGDAPAAGAHANADPKWQEVATKLDLAKAYEEMGDKDGARELLNEVVREGDAAQQGQAQQLLAKLG